MRTANMLRKAISNALYATASFAAQSYVAGRSCGDAMRVCRRLSRSGWKFTICAWDSPGDSKEGVFRAYQEGLSEILITDLDVYLSIKAPSLGYDRELIVALVEQAANKGTRVHFDSLDLDSADRTLDLAAELAGQFPNIGITIPSRWGRSIEDARRFAKLPVAIRLVKGQWADPALDSARIDGNFLEIADILRGRNHPVGVASHDAALAALAIEKLSESSTPCELEQLYGLPYRTALTRTAVPLRVYVPYGSAYLPYAVSMLRKRPVVLWWLIRDAAFSLLWIAE